MAHTVVGFFDNISDAQNAVDELIEEGFDRSEIDISSGNSSSDSDSVSNVDTENAGNRKSGISKFFSSLFGDDSDDARKYSRVGANANTIVTVHTDSEEEAETAADILDDNNAFDIDERAAQYGSDSSNNLASSTTGTTTSTRTGSDNDETIERIQEDLEVGKRTVETGGVRVRSRIVSRPVEETVRLREEHVTVERTPVDRPVSRGGLGSFEEREIEMTERAEVPVVSKEARVVEEIRVSKESNERAETIRETVRNTEVDIDDLDRSNASAATGTSDPDRANLSGSSDLNDLDRTDLSGTGGLSGSSDLSNKNSGINRNLDDDRTGRL